MAEKLKTIRNQNLKNKFRFVVLNDETFEEKFSLILTRTNVWIFLSTIAVILILLTTTAIIYTPLKYFIPGFGDYNYRGQIINLKFKTDSMEQALHDRAVWLENISNVINGTIDTTRPGIVKNSNLDKSKVDLNDLTEGELNLRKEVEEEQSFALSNKGKAGDEALSEVKQQHFIAPVQGFITEEFNPDKDHFGIDIVCPEDAPVKATMDGKVIADSWTLETGYVITVQHNNNLISMYKHNSRLLKKTGNTVKAGEAIAVVGNSGEMTTGPHLHFELWYNGVAIDPRNYIAF